MPRILPLVGFALLALFISRQSHAEGQDPAATAPPSITDSMTAQLFNLGDAAESLPPPPNMSAREDARKIGAPSTLWLAGRAYTHVGELPEPDACSLEITDGEDVAVALIDEDGNLHITGEFWIDGQRLTPFYGLRKGIPDDY